MWGGGEKSRHESQAENWATSCRPHPWPCSAQSSPGAPCRATSSLEHHFTPFRHLLRVSHSTRLPSLPSPGSQAPTSSLPITQTPAAFPDLRSQPSRQYSPCFPGSFPVCADLCYPSIPKLVDLPFHSRSESPAQPSFPTAPSPSEQPFLPLSVQAEEAGKSSDPESSEIAPQSSCGFSASAAAETRTGLPLETADSGMIPA